MKKIAIQVAGILLFGVFGAVLTRAFHPRAPALYLAQEPLGDHQLRLGDIAERWSGDVLWIDARPEEDFLAGHHPGAISINETNWNDAVFEHVEVIQEAAKPFVVYCSSHACKASHKIAQRLRQNFPLAEVYVLRGGWPVLREADPAR
ncbi:MAG: rhodanese-like domain-containing protein [Verrucomicrobiales bacterium]